MASQNRAALAGLRIIDFSHVWQGPVGTQLLADFGADVIKIERPDFGDWSRQWGPYIGGVSMPFAGLNRNKRSMAINLKFNEGRQIIFKLLDQADVLVHNFRPGAMEKLSLGYEDLKDSHPSLIYAYSTGWGDSGPYVERRRAGHDALARAESGLFYAPTPDDLPVPAGISVDYPTGLMLIQGILIALFHREKTGKGQLVTTDLFSVGFHTNVWKSAAILNKSRVEDESGVGATEAAINKAFRTKDGLLELSPVFSENSLRDISLAMGLSDLSTDDRFSTQKKQLENMEELNAILRDKFLERTTSDWISTLEPRGVLCGEIRSFEQASLDPQIEANQMIIEMEHNRIGNLRLLGTPLRLSETPSAHLRPPADLGEHNEEILLEIGYSEGEISDLRQAGVIK